jgi:ubiquitin carboxyl-terminal hydrolase L3
VIAEVFNELVYKLGVSEELGFHDIYSLDDPDLLAFVPRPVHALIFIAPGAIYHQVREQDTNAGHGTKDLTYDGSGEDEPVIWVG